MEKEKSFLSKEFHTKGISGMEKDTDREFCLRLTGPNTKESLWMEILKAEADLCGPMAKSTKESGKWGKCMEKEVC